MKPYFDEKNSKKMDFFSGMFCQSKNTIYICIRKQGKAGLHKQKCLT